MMHRRQIQTARSMSPLLKSLVAVPPVPRALIEGLEDRRLMSASGFFGGGGGGHHGGGFDGGPGGLGRGPGGQGSTILFSQAPSAVQSGLTALASTDGVTAPTSSSTVYLGNFNGIESYTVDVTSTGTDTRLTVDQTGSAVTAPTQTTTTFGAITNSAVTSEITAIAAGLGLTAPTSTTTVDVSTPTSGAATYTVRLDSTSSASTTSSWHEDHGGVISVDTNGNPVGNERVPLSTLSTTIQDGLTSNAPSGATALASTDLVSVRTIDGVTTYTANYTSTGTQTTVTVGTDGALVSLPTTTQVDFSTLPAAAQAELQTLATADGVSGTISSTQTVSAYAELNGTTIYTVRLQATSTSSSSTSSTYTIALSVDQAGNPTIPPGRFGHGFGGHDGGFFFGGGDCDCGGGSTSSTGTTTTTTTPTPTSTTTTTTTPASSLQVSSAGGILTSAAVAAPSGTSSSSTTTMTPTPTSTTTVRKHAKHKTHHHKKA